MGSGDSSPSKCAGGGDTWLAGLDALSAPSALAGLAAGRRQQEISRWTEHEVRVCLLLTARLPWAARAH